MSDEPMPGYLEYLQRQDERRVEAVDAILAKMPVKVRALFREAAVMGYFLGQADAGGIRRDDYPKDSNVVVRAVDAMRVNPDLYPVTTGLESDEETLP